MWQPNKVQWRLIWVVAILLILAWPADNGGLVIKLINWAADPHETLPREPAPLGPGLGDDPIAVDEHDAEEQAYYHMYQTSGFSRFRLQARDLRDPFDPSTERQVLVGLALLFALGIWRANAKSSHP